MNIERNGDSMALRRGWPAALELFVGRSVECVAGAIVAILGLILFAGMAARYVFHSPLVWADELGSILFLWLGVLGSVVAFRRGGHMRMTGFVNMLAPGARGFCEVAATVAALAFLLLVTWPAYLYAREEDAVASLALGLSGTWRAAAFPVGTALMAVVAVLRLATVDNRRLVLGSVLLVGGIIGGFILLGPLLAPLGKLNLVIFFGIILALGVFAGIPIAFAFALSTFGYVALTTSVPTMIIVDRTEDGMSHIILLAIPMFVFLGYFIESTGMARAMLMFLVNILGRVRGGLSYATVAAMYLVSGISGSKAADMAAVAPVLFPEMKRRGDKPGALVAMLAATCAQTETIPPSLVLITIGSVTDVSISALFTGGLIPATLLGLILCAVIWSRSRNAAPALSERIDRRTLQRNLIIALPALVLPFVIRTAVVEGVATATEVSTVGIFYAFIASAIFYQRNWRRLGPMLVDTAALSGAILFITGSATAMGWALTQSGFSMSLANAVQALPGGSMSFLFASIVAFIVLGSILEGIPAITLFAPLLFPIARSLGIHEVHYAIVVILAMGIGLHLPPFGVGYYVACAIGGASPSEAVRPIVGYMLALLVGLALVAAIPWLSVGFLG